MMSFIESIKTCYKKSFTTRGRATRSEYWWFMLYFYLLLILGMAFIKIEVIFGIFMIVWSLTLVPAFTARIRRLHDTGHSGYNILWGCIPYVGAIGGIYLLILECQGSDCYENKYGPCPKNLDFLDDSNKGVTQISSSQAYVSNSQEVAHQTSSCESGKKSKEETLAKVEEIKVYENSKDWEEI